MSQSLVRESAQWKDYELLDSGEFEKLERFGNVVLVRPEPQALWKKENPDLWKQAHATYSRSGEAGEWQMLKKIPGDWQIEWENLRFHLELTSFKHTGLFPEQASNWAWIRANVKEGMQVLNLFGYTGGATLAAASREASATHVDASKPVVTWAHENADRSNLGETAIRWIVDDAMKFVAREMRRGKQYDAIFMDPPAFGRGPDGELWKFEEHLPKLLSMCAEILNKQSGILLVNAYSLGFPALAVENLVRTQIGFAKKIDAVELTLEESGTRKFLLPTGVAIRATW